MPLRGRGCRGAGITERAPTPGPRNESILELPARRVWEAGVESRARRSAHHRITHHSPKQAAVSASVSEPRRSHSSTKSRNKSTMSKQQKRMPYVRLGNTGLKVSRIIL